ncbi:unnamed protein product, partial [Staurois parvus]
MYVKWFDTVMFYDVILEHLVECHFLTFLNFPSVPSPYVLKSQGTEPRRRMSASAGGHCRGRCRGGHRGSAGQGKCRRDPGATLLVTPECSSGLPLVLHSGIPPGRLRK